MPNLAALPVSIIFLCMAVLLYGLLGSPTPDNPGAVEIIIGCLLVLSVVAAGARRGVSLFARRNFYLKAVQVFFICGLVFPLASGFYFGNDQSIILRDVIAFAFLGLPLFLSEKIYETEDAPGALRFFILLGGLFFAVRTLIPAFNVWIPEGELLYFSNSPLCIFAAVFFACALFDELGDIRRAKILKSVFFLCGLCLIVAAMLLDVQRATIGAVFISVAVYALLSFIRAPKRTVLPLVIICGLSAAIYPMLSDVFAVIAEKTAAVGWNMRFQEARAVFDYLAAEPVRLFTGSGWGGVFASPAVGGVEVAYTHSFLTTMVLKGGIVMLLLSLVVVLSAFVQIFLIFQRDKTMALALFWPLAIPAFLYASHKSFDFGLILLMIGVWSIARGALHSPDPSDKKHEKLI